MPLLRQREVVADSWVTVGAAADAVVPADDVAVIVPFAKFRENPDAWRGRKGLLGIRLSPADKVEDLAPELPRLSLVAVEFTGLARDVGTHRRSFFARGITLRAKCERLGTSSRIRFI